MRATVADPAGQDLNPHPGDRDRDDSALVARCLAGDDAGWRQLVGRYGSLVEAVIRRYHLPVEERADVFQDVWLELWRALPALRNRERLAPWLVTLAGRLAWDARKRLPRYAESAAAEHAFERLVDESANPEQEAARHEVSARVQVALAQLSPRCRALLQALYYEEAASYVQVAARLGCSPNSIGPIRGRCFSELRAALSAPSPGEQASDGWEARRA
jgi:RNA polymerase sigma factor (sigma-70 family)